MPGQKFFHWGQWIIAKTLTRILTILLVVVGITACSIGSESSKNTTSSQVLSQNATKSNPKAINSDPTAGSNLSIQELSIHEEYGQTIISLRFTQPIVQYRHFTLPQPARIVLDIMNDNVKPALDTYRIETNWVSALRVMSNDSSLRLTVEIAAASVPSYTIAGENGGLKVVIGAEDPKITTRKNLTLVKDGKRTELFGGKLACPSIGELKLTSAVPSTTEKKYIGQKISLEFKDADIKNVFRLIGELSNKNFVVTDEVNQRLTIRLIEVPWDQALDIIIDTNGLAKEELNDVIRISTAARLAQDRKSQLAYRNAARSVELPEIIYLNVNYATAKELAEKVKQIVKTGADIVPDERSNTIVVRGLSSEVQAISCMVARLDSRTPQVLIESNLIETTPTFSRALGIQMETLFNNGRVQSSTRFRADPPFNDASFTFPENATPIFTPATGFNFAYFGNSVAALLSAAEAEGNVKIISRPSVVTLNNKESQIESANIVRIRTSAATVGEAGALREIRAGITLKVTPQVSVDGFVLLSITAKSSTLDFGRTVDGIPQENTREAKANVLVRDGETVVIGGIMKDTSANSESGVPYLKEIPGLGWLFKKSSWQKDFEELVVFITPRVLESGSENLPTAEQLWRDQLRQTQGTQAAPLNP